MNLIHDINLKLSLIIGFETRLSMSNKLR